MNKRYRLKGALGSIALAAIATAIPGNIAAGNIPQYRVTKGDNIYSEFTDGIAIPCDWSEGRSMLRPSGEEASRGFPIGFDFRFGGVSFDHFILASGGAVYLGNDRNGFGGGFSISMTPIMNGLKSGEISYRLTGTEGDRCLEVQWRNALLNTSMAYNGQYSLQFRLYEKDGRVEIAFKEIETPSERHGFGTSIRGWDGNDAIVLTASGIDNAISISPKRRTDMLDPDTYIKWDPEDFDQNYTPVFLFTPAPETPAPASAPTGLTVTQNGTDLEISCRRGADASATVVLISTDPFTDSDMPVDGETFRAAYEDSEGSQYFPTRFGNALPLLYNDEEEVTTTFRGVENGKSYYVRAISVNGYPAYNRTAVAETIFATTQAPPTAFSAEAVDMETIRLSVEADDPVIVAATTQREPEHGKGYRGFFGLPSPDAAAGDEIEGGGRVVFAGNAGEFTAVTLPNAMTYFRAWTVKDGRLSALTADCASAPEPSYPFVPALENFPPGESLQGWSTYPRRNIGFIPVQRNVSSDFALMTTSVQGERISLRSPILPLDRPLKVYFEWAMETLRPAEATEDSAGVELPKGNKPGEFGSGSLDLLVNGEVCHSVNRYDGTMEIFTGDDYIDGTSTFVPFSTEIPKGSGSGSIEISFAADPDHNSILYMRALRVEEADNSSVTDIAPDSADTRENVIYNVAGVRLRYDDPSQLSPGLYILNGRKILVK